MILLINKLSLILLTSVYFTKKKVKGSKIQKIADFSPKRSIYWQAAEQTGAQEGLKGP